MKMKNKRQLVNRIKKIQLDFLGNLSCKIHGKEQRDRPKISQNCMVNKLCLKLSKLICADKRQKLATVDCRRLY